MEHAKLSVSVPLLFLIAAHSVRSSSRRSMPAARTEPTGHSAPALQGLHSASKTLLKRPAAHGWHGPMERFVAILVPRGQASQDCEDVEPGEEEVKVVQDIRPHDAHAVSCEVLPEEVPYEPSAHCLHAEVSDVWPLSEPNFPRSQSVHAVWPLSEPNFPRSQLVQASAALD